MKGRRNSIWADISYLVLLILIFLAMLFFGYDHLNLASNGILLCLVLALLLITYFTSLKIGLLLNLIFLFLYLTYTVARSVEIGLRVNGNVYFWIFWPVAMVLAISGYVHRNKLLDQENQELVKRTEKYTTIDELTQMNNLLAFERDATVYMNLSRRYQMPLELVLWRLNVQEEHGQVISRISDAIKESLRKEDLIYIVDKEPYIWGTLMFSKPEAAEIVIGHVKEGVLKTNLNGIAGKKEISLNILGTVLSYDGSQMTPLGFLQKGKKKLDRDYNIKK